MNDQRPEPDAEQMTVWRNLLDALAQLDSAWQATKEAMEQEGGPTPQTPLAASVTRSFTHAGRQAAEALAGIAKALDQTSDEQQFAALLEAQREAWRQWSDAYDAIGSSENSAG